mgnify:CR=1 FL=1
MSRQTPHIVRDLLEEPHVRGRRVSVLQIREEIESLGRAPEDVADDYDLDMTAVYRALAYYHEHPDEMEAVRSRRERELSDIEREIDSGRPENATPP